jgi:hypothetical protein
MNTPLQDAPIRLHCAWRWRTQEATLAARATGVDSPRRSNAKPGNRTASQLEIDEISASTAKKRPSSSTKGFPSTLAVKTSIRAGAPVSFAITRDDANSICVIPMK